MLHSSSRRRGREAFCGSGRERSWNKSWIWERAEGEVRSGSGRLMWASMPVMKSMRWNGVVKLAVVGGRVFSELKLKLKVWMWEAIPAKRVSVVVMRSSRLA